MDMTVNLNYNVNGPLNFIGEHDEVIYDEIGTGAIGTGIGVGCRRHGVYAGNNEEMNDSEMEPHSIYDVVL